MSIQDLGSIGELIAAIATLGTLVYLAIQIKSNTTAIKTSSSWDAHHTFVDVDDMLAQGGELSELVFRTWNDESVSDFTAYELFQLEMFGRGYFQRLEAQYFLYKAGQLDPQIWENRRRFNQMLLDIPYWRTFWEKESTGFNVTQEFMQHMIKVDE